jgi:hypothetical protein
VFFFGFVLAFHEVDDTFADVAGDKFVVAVSEHFFTKSRIATSEVEDVVGWLDDCLEDRFELDPSLVPVEVVLEAKKYEGSY